MPPPRRRRAAQEAAKGGRRGAGGKREEGDRAVRGTNDDATVSKHSAVSLGYFKDDFVRFFVPRPSRRAPLINRGYYARMLAFDRVLSEFLEAGGTQVVSLGAGFDTAYFRLKARGQPVAAYFEVDFPETVRRKADTLARHPEFGALLDEGEGGERWKGYRLVGADLRDTAGLEEGLRASGADFGAPTLLLAECVLVYMEARDSDAVVAWAARAFTGGAVFANYEQVRPHDPFGRTMVRNLRERGCGLLGVEAHPTLRSQEERFTAAGWDAARAWDMNDVYSHYLPRDDVLRAERLEMFDEFEEWFLIQAHYCIAVARREPAAAAGGAGVNLAAVGFLDGRRRSAAGAGAAAVPDAGDARAALARGGFPEPAN